MRTLWHAGATFLERAGGAGATGGRSEGVAGFLMALRRNRFAYSDPASSL
ncbi:hypothetical protein [Actinomadura rifamycini]|nr:hypothetical protein [Actinomadura rifamycini]